MRGAPNPLLCVALRGGLPALRYRLQSAPPDRPPIRFSVGFAHLPARGDAEAVVREADEAMYRNKDATRRNGFGVRA